ncbi:MAG: tRNA pseudouridine(55) synthase TruB [Chlamydiae bacterium]|nr:tRNA pseudouridine(55) synthase TruB [Chlamydiota bacterium]
MNLPLSSNPSGILLINKPKGKTSFSLVAMLRRIYGVQKIGHAGTLDPFATGVMILLVGKNYTRKADSFLCEDKAYEAVLKLGEITDTYDHEGQILSTSSLIPSLEDIKKIVEKYQGTMQQIPPMFSAKKIKGQRLYKLARQGITVDRQSREVQVTSRILSYQYPFLHIHFDCSKGTYIRSLAFDIGNDLGCGAHLSDLKRIRSGNFHINDCIDPAFLLNPPPDFDLCSLLKK